MCTSKLPEQASLSWVPKSGQVKKLLRVSTSAGSSLSKTRMLSLSFSLLPSSGSLQSSSNTQHITLSESASKPFLHSQRLDLNVFSLCYVTLIDVYN